MRHDVDEYFSSDPMRHHGGFPVTREGYFLPEIMSPEEMQRQWTRGEEHLHEPETTAHHYQDDAEADDKAEMGKEKMLAEVVFQCHDKCGNDLGLSRASSRWAARASCNQACPKPVEGTAQKCEMFSWLQACHDKCHHDQKCHELCPLPKCPTGAQLARSFRNYILACHAGCNDPDSHHECWARAIAGWAPKSYCHAIEDNLRCYKGCLESDDNCHRSCLGLDAVDAEQEESERCSWDDKMRGAVVV